MLFSQRYGFQEIKSLIQTDSMDEDLKNGLWNAFYISFLYDAKVNTYGSIESYKHETLTRAIYLNYFKFPVDEIPYRWSNIVEKIKSYFYSTEWFNVYDFIEFSVNQLDEDGGIPRRFNIILERELSAYRFVGKNLTKITKEEEIGSIEEALKVNSTTHYASKHIQESLKLLANRKTPDYRNSIKEAISAVEAISTAITNAVGCNSSTLGQALKEIEKKTDVELHPALKQAFDKLYGYTSDGGVRHYLKDETHIDFEDAKFMLVACSAFVNYLTAKSAKAGISL